MRVLIYQEMIEIDFDRTVAECGNIYCSGVESISIDEKEMRDLMLILTEMFTCPNCKEPGWLHGLFLNEEEIICNNCNHGWSLGKV